MSNKVATPRKTHSKKRERSNTYWNYEPLQQSDITLSKKEASSLNKIVDQLIRDSEIDHIAIPMIAKLKYVIKKRIKDAELNGLVNTSQKLQEHLEKLEGYTKSLLNNTNENNINTDNLTNEELKNMYDIKTRSLEELQRYYAVEYVRLAKEREEAHSSLVKSFDEKNAEIDLFFNNSMQKVEYSGRVREKENYIKELASQRRYKEARDEKANLNHIKQEENYELFLGLKKEAMARKINLKEYHDKQVKELNSHWDNTEDELEKCRRIDVNTTQRILAQLREALNKRDIDVDCERPKDNEKYSGIIDETVTVRRCDADRPRWIPFTKNSCIPYPDLSTSEVTITVASIHQSNINDESFDEIGMGKESDVLLKPGFRKQSSLKNSHSKGVSSGAQYSSSNRIRSSSIPKIRSSDIGANSKKTPINNKSRKEKRVEITGTPKKKRSEHTPSARNATPTNNAGATRYDYGVNSGSKTNGRNGRAISTPNAGSKGVSCPPPINNKNITPHRASEMLNPTPGKTFQTTPSQSTSFNNRTPGNNQYRTPHQGRNFNPTPTNKRSPAPGLDKGDSARKEINDDITSGKTRSNRLSNKRVGAANSKGKKNKKGRVSTSPKGNGTVNANTGRIMASNSSKKAATSCNKFGKEQNSIQMKGSTSTQKPMKTFRYINSSHSTGTGVRREVSPQTWMSAKSASTSIRIMGPSPMQNLVKYSATPTQNKSKLQSIMKPPPGSIRSRSLSPVGQNGVSIAKVSVYGNLLPSVSGLVNDKPSTVVDDPPSEVNNMSLLYNESTDELGGRRFKPDDIPEHSSSLLGQGEYKHKEKTLRMSPRGMTRKVPKDESINEEGEVYESTQMKTDEGSPRNEMSDISDIPLIRSDEGLNHSRVESTEFSQGKYEQSQYTYSKTDESNDDIKNKDPSGGVDVKSGGVSDDKIADDVHNAIVNDAKTVSSEEHGKDKKKKKGCIFCGVDDDSSEYGKKRNKSKKLCGYDKDDDVSTNDSSKKHNNDKVKNESKDVDKDIKHFETPDGDITKGQHADNVKIDTASISSSKSQKEKKDRSSERHYDEYEINSGSGSINKSQKKNEGQNGEKLYDELEIDIGSVSINKPQKKNEGQNGEELYDEFAINIGSGSTSRSQKKNEDQNDEKHADEDDSKDEDVPCVIFRKRKKGNKKEKHAKDDEVKNENDINAQTQKNEDDSKNKHIGEDVIISGHDSSSRSSRSRSDHSKNKHIGEDVIISEHGSSVGSRKSRSDHSKNKHIEEYEIISGHDSSSRSSRSRSDRKNNKHIEEVEIRSEIDSSARSSKIEEKDQEYYHYDYDDNDKSGAATGEHDDKKKLTDNNVENKSASSSSRSRESKLESRMKEQAECEKAEGKCILCSFSRSQKKEKEKQSNVDHSVNGVATPTAKANEHNSESVRNGDNVNDKAKSDVTPTKKKENKGKKGTCNSSDDDDKAGCITSKKAKNNKTQSGSGKGDIVIPEELKLENETISAESAHSTDNYYSETDYTILSD